MKKIGITVLAFLLLISFGLIVSADTWPKPSIDVKIKGISGEYVAAFAAKKASGPNFDYQGYLEHNFTHLEYNSIMEYNDADGFKWITKYFNCKDEAEVGFYYYRPEEFKIVIYKNDELYKATDIIDCYAYNSYFEINFENDEILVTKDYYYSREILKFLLRVIVTLLAEIGLFLIFRLYTKRNFEIVLITNLFTQIILNLFVNIHSFIHGSLSALLLFFFGEVLVVIIETLVYGFTLKEKNKILVVAYGILANILSIGLGFLLWFI